MDFPNKKIVQGLVDSHLGELSSTDTF